MQRAFKKLKIELISALLSVFLDFKVPLAVKTNESSEAIKIALFEKKDDGKLYPDQFSSDTM